jgi:membrane-bound lytic murein transglycosylase B
VALATYAHTHGEDVYAIKGSWAGAIGIVQFLPENLVAFGEDYDHDGKVNLYSLGDAVMSAAKLLRFNGWSESADSQMSAISMYYCGFGYHTEKAQKRGGRAYTDLVFLIRDAISEDAHALQGIVRKAASRFPLTN